MPGVILLQPGPVFLDPHQIPVHVDAALIANGAAVLNGYGATEVSLFINVKAAPTGTLPVLQYTLQEVDPGDESTPIGNTISSTAINAPGIQRLTLFLTYGGTVKISWTLSGTIPSFTQVYATLVSKSGSVKLADAAGNLVGSVTNPLHIDVTGTTVQPVLTVTPSGDPAIDASYLVSDMLSELRQMRKLLEILTDESVQDEE